jgi:hypothetical protein
MSILAWIGLIWVLNVVGGVVLALVLILCDRISRWRRRNA